MPPAPAQILRALSLAGFLAGAATSVRADARVTVVANADEEYAAAKLANGKAVETYVIMQGHYFDGHTVDRSIERMPFRKIAEYLGGQLARQNFLPAISPRNAKLLIVVHWGTTAPRLSHQEMFGGTNVTTPSPGAAEVATFLKANPSGQYEGLPPPPDTTQTPEANDLESVTLRLMGNISEGNAARLLGYQDEIHRLGKRAYADATNDIINYHLSNERYFITLMAYDMKELRESYRRRRPVWSLHLNISSPGNNFDTALTRISEVAGDFAGRSIDGLQNVRPAGRGGTVTIAPLVIIGEASLRSK
ncbi:MAG TPA: hypothetical protein VG734_05005 [Lacunisphaera sp.]|nr:hypothetical protein [Lacunisphaera sp.]